MLVKLSKKLYSEKAITAAIEDYKEVAKFEASSDRRYITLNIKPLSDTDAVLIKKEFCNYVIAMTKR